MPQKTLILLATIFCVACAGGQQNQRQASEHQELSPEPVAGAPEQVEVADYLEFLEELRASVESNEFRDFSQREVRSFQRLEQELRDELTGVERIDELGERSKLRVFNLHEELQGVVIGDPDNVVICRRQHRVGTNFRDTTCISASDFRRDQDASREQLRQMLGPGPMPVID